MFNQKADGTAWRTRPSWYIVANHDRTVQPDLERSAAKRMGAHTYHVDSSHVPMLPHPDFVFDVDSRQLHLNRRRKLRKLPDAR